MDNRCLNRDPDAMLSPEFAAVIKGLSHVKEKLWSTIRISTEVDGIGCTVKRGIRRPRFEALDLDGMQDFAF